MTNTNNPISGVQQIAIPDPVDIYMRYLAVKNEEKQAERAAANVKKYSASSAGLCIRKPWYDYNNYSRALSEPEDVRKMRLGTVMGRDFDDAMQWFIDEQLEAQVPNDDIEIYYETAVSHKELNLNGHFDLLIVKKTIDGPNLVKLGYLYDYKTAHSWKFSRLFGQNLDKSPSNNYEYQLGTYGFMIEESNEFCDAIVHMENIYINKNDSVIKSKIADLGYMEYAKKYWTMVNKYQKMGSPPEFSLGESGRAPYKKWECGKYCDFREHCPSPFKNKG